MTVNLATLQTEQKNSRTTDIDAVSSLELCRELMPVESRKG